MKLEPGNIPVVWLSYHQPEILARGYWDQGLLEEFLVGYDHRDSFEDIKGGAIVILNGRTHTDEEDIKRLNKDLAKLSWCLFIDTGDEEAKFPITAVKHPRMKVWAQLPRMGTYDHTYHLPNGYRPTTRELIKSTGMQERTINWFFAGQINHRRREDCLNVLTGMGDGELSPTRTFGHEQINYPAYIMRMAQSKIIPCPSGIESPDNFRVYEALEAGCIPVVDAYSTNYPTPGFWKYLLGDDIPFPIISEWSVFPEIKKQLLAEWPRNANRIFAWWLSKKADIKHQLEEDIKELWK